MKKSEMLTVIKNTLGYSLMDFEVKAILAALEAAGMSPPRYTKEITFDDLTLFKTVEGWEPED